MPESERLRQKKEREFQKRVLAALEGAKPKKGRIGGIINSAFFLWLLSAVVITAGGAFFTKRQECLGEAHRVQDIWSKLARELYTRESYVLKTIQRASTIEEVKERVPKCSWLYNEYKERSTGEISNSLYDLLRDHSGPPMEPSLDDGKDRLAKEAFFKRFGETAPVTGEDEDYEKLFECVYPVELEDVSLKKLKAYAKYRELTSEQYDLISGGALDTVKFVSSCSATDLFRQFIDGSLATIEIVRPTLDDESKRRSLASISEEDVLGPLLPSQSPPSRKR